MCVWLCLAGSALAATPAPTVTVASGTLAGLADGHGGALFLGVPYAAAPIGKWRWRAPRKPQPWQGIRQAVHEPPACLQNNYQWNRHAARHDSEDCLYLDVHTPKLHPSHLLPVMVWIHGGSNRAGAAAGTVYTDLVRRGIVVVAIQYRLGVLGFLSTPALSAQQGGHSGNYGLMDQLRALQWVRHNIARFGGDPGQVTIAGQSAGAMDVGLLTVFDSSRHLFVRAWATGGVPMFGEPVRSLQANEALGLQLESILGVKDDPAVLRKLPASRLLKAALKLHTPVLAANSYTWLQAVVDGRVIPESPARALARGVAGAVPYVVSTNRIELPLAGGNAWIKRSLQQVFGAQASAAEHFYGLGGKGGAVDARDASYGNLLQRMGTDIRFRCPADRVTDQYAEHGGRTWRAQMSVTSDHGPSHHSAELGFLFNNLPLDTAHPGVSLQDYFARFIKTGNPNGPGMAVWPRVRPGQGQYVDFTYRGVSAGQHLGGAICRLQNGTGSRFSSLE
ncbi:MAG TPA: carboxylesterase family protein [Rhodanobacteraceae bacterium]